MTGLSFGESPRWHDGRLWLSDWGASEALAADEAGNRPVVAVLPSFPSCIEHVWPTTHGALGSQFLADMGSLLTDPAQFLAWS